MLSSGSECFIHIWQSEERHELLQARAPELSRRGFDPTFRNEKREGELSRPSRKVIRILWFRRLAAASDPVTGQRTNPSVVVGVAPEVPVTPRV